MIRKQRFVVFLLCALLFSLQTFGGYAQTAPQFIAYNETRSGFLTTQAASQSWVFSGNTREIVHITARRIGGQFSPRLRLFDVNQTLLAEGQNGANAYVHEIILPAGLPSDGEYRIEISSAQPLVDSVEQPNEYSVTLMHLGTRRGRLVDALPTIGTESELPPILISDNLIAADSNPLDINLYNALAPIEQPDTAQLRQVYAVSAASGTGQITVSDARPLSRVIEALSFVEGGLGFISTTNTVFFTDRPIITLVHEPDGIVTINLDGENPQTIVTDFYNIASIQAVDNLVVVLLTNGQRLILSGTSVDLRRRARQGSSEEPIFEIRLDGNRFIHTDLMGWHTLAYLGDGQVRVLYSEDGQLISDQVRLDLFQDDAAPAFSNITLYDLLSNNTLAATSTLRIDWMSASSNENNGLFLIGDVVLTEYSLRILPLDGREILEDFTFSEDRRAVSDVLIEQGAIRIHRADDTYRLSLPDATEIHTPLASATNNAALPYEAGYIPQGLNNLGADALPTMPAMNFIEDALPINPVNGNFYYPAQDFYIPSHTLELKLERYYNSQADALTPDYMQAASHRFGQGWRHSYQLELDIRQAAFGQVMLILPQGTRHLFNVGEDGVTYRSATLLAWSVERIGGILGRWTAKTPDGIEYQFDRAGRLRQIVDANGHALFFSPAPHEYLSAGADGLFIVEPYGRRLELYTDTARRIILARDTLARTITYTYDADLLTGVQYLDPQQNALYTYNADGILTFFNDAYSPYHQSGAINYDVRRRVSAYTENPSGPQRQFAYAYDDSQRLFTRSTSITGEPQPRVDTWQYDEQFHIIGYTAARPEFTYGYTYDRDTHLLVEVRQPDLNLFRFTYNAQGYLIRLRDPRYVEADYRFTYETRGSRILLQEISYPNRGRATFVYEDTLSARLIEARQLVTEQSEQERVRRFLYDEWGRIAAIINLGAHGEDVPTVYGYDTFGYVASVTTRDRQVRFTHDILGRLRSITDGNGNQYALDWSNVQNVLTAIYGPEGFHHTYDYDALGRIIEWVDRGNLTQYKYNDLNQVVEVINAIGQSTTFTYDEANNLLNQTDWNGRTYRYTYDALNNLTSLTTPGGQTTIYSFGLEAGGDYTFRRVEDPAGQVTNYRYDSLGRLERVTLTNGDEERGYQFVYDRVGNITELNEEYKNRNLRAAYNLIGQVTSTEIEGATTDYTYDLAGNLLSVTDPSGLTTSYTHDVFGNVTTVVFADGSQYSYRYDANNNLIAMVDALGQETLYTYDALNRVTSMTEPGGHVTQYAYDVRGNLVSVTDPMGNTRTAVYDTLDQMTSLVDAMGNEIVYEYDEFNRLARSDAPLSLTTQYAYNLDDQIVAITETGGRQTIFDYDVLGRLSSVTDALGHTYLYSYNQFDSIVSITDPLGNTQQFEWRNGRLDFFTAANGRRYDYNQDNTGQLETIRDTIDGGVNLRFTYDAAGRIVEIEAGSDRLFSNSRETAWGYAYSDTRGWLDAYTDPLGHQWLYVRDALGRITSVQAPDGTLTQYEYDDAGHITRIVYAAGTDAETSEQFTYDANGNVTQHTARDGVITAYRYDANNRLVEMIESVGTPLERTTRYEYDEVGNLTRTVDPNGREIIYRYDPFGNRTRVVLVSGEDGIAYEYSYDLMGNLVGSTLPEGQSISMSYDALNRRVRYVDAENGVWAYTYDSGGNLTQVSDPLGNVTVYRYDVLNRLTQITYPSGASVDLTYGERGEFESVTAPATGSPDTTREITEYVLDASGNLVRIVDSANSDDPRETRLEYNAFGQIISRETAMGITRYRYDAMGNLVEIAYPNGATQTRTYDAAGRLTSITAPTGVISMDYDALGRLIRVRADGTTINYEYDGVDNLLRRDAGELGAVLYTYDSLYRPIGVQYGDQSIELVYDRNGWRTQLARSNGVNTNYTYDANGRPQVITHITENGDLLDGFSYFYDVVGNLTRIDRIDQWAVLYSYNTSQQIIDERWLNDTNDARYTMSVLYDSAGNIIEATRDGVRTRYAYDERNQLIGEDRNYNPTETEALSWLPLVGLVLGVGYWRGKNLRPLRQFLWLSPLAITLLIFPSLQQRSQAPEFDVTYSYYEDGNLQQIVYTSSSYTLDFSYDFDGRLVGIVGTREDGTAVEIQLIYDALGRLTNWRSGDLSYQLIYDGDTVIAVRSTSVTRYFVPFPGEQLLRIFGDENPIWALQDATLLPRQLLNGDASEGLEFNVFGLPINPYQRDTRPLAAPMLLAANQLFDPLSQLYVEDGRAYDPALNRYAQPNAVRHDPRITLYGEANAPLNGSAPPEGIAYRYLYEGTFAPILLDTVRPRAAVGEMIPSVTTVPTTAQLQAEENVRFLRLLERLNGQQTVVRGFLSPLSSSPIDRRSMPAMLQHYTAEVGWLPHVQPNPLRLPGPLALLTDISSLITTPMGIMRPSNRGEMPYLDFVDLPNPDAAALQREAELAEMLQEVQLIPALLPEVEMLADVLPQPGLPSLPPTAIDTPQPVIIPPVLNELYHLYRPLLEDQDELFPTVIGGNRQLTP